MTLDDVDRLFAHWADYPPTRDLVAAQIGFKPRQREAAADLSELVAMFPGGVIK